MSFIDKLSALSAAEEFFELLGVEYDPAVVRVARLHILRRMGELMADSKLEELPDDEAEAVCRADLEKAYALFQESSPIEQRLFKVHKDAIKPAEPPKKPFVPLTELTGSQD